MNNKLLKINELLKLEEPVLLNIDSGIYFLFNSNELIYVGISTNIQKRIMTHRSDKDFNKATFISGDIKSFTKNESDYIYHFLPKYNKIISDTSEYINIKLIKNLKILGNVEFKCKLINGTMYLDKFTILKDFNIIYDEKNKIILKTITNGREKNK